MTPSKLRRVAVHEAGHFVLANLMGLGAVTLLTARPSHDSTWGTTDGKMLRSPSPMERTYLAEAAGNDLEALFTDEALDIYRSAKPHFINQKVIMHLAGPAAEKALAGGDGSLSEGDYFQARDAALTIMPTSEVAGYLERRLKETGDLCLGTLKAPILAVAERLISKGTLDRQECDALWQEVDPRVDRSEPEMKARGVIKPGPWREFLVRSQFAAMVDERDRRRR